MVLEDGGEPSSELKKTFTGSEAEGTPLRQAVAKNNAESLARVQDMILPELWELNRWMLASLLALNTAAGAAVFADSAIHYETKASACWFFIGGALAALSSGFILTFILRSMEQAVTTAQIYWAAVAGGFDRSDQHEGSHKAAAISANRWTWLPQVALLASAVLFILGVTRL